MVLQVSDFSASRHALLVIAPRHPNASEVAQLARDQAS